MRADEIPLTESLKDTVARFLPYWHETIAPAVKSGQRVLIAAHGNSLRALVKYLDNVPDDEIVELNIPTGIPLVYELDDRCGRFATTTWAIPKPPRAQPPTSPHKARASNSASFTLTLHFCQETTGEWRTEEQADLFSLFSCWLTPFSLQALRFSLEP